MSCTDIHTKYSTHCVVFVSLLKISEPYIISKSHGRAVLKADHHFSYVLINNTADYILSIHPRQREGQES